MTLSAPAFLADLCEDPAAALERHGDAVEEWAAMRSCPQPANHHSEGSVWNHTLLALEVLADLPESVARAAGDELAAAGLTDLALPSPRLTLAYAVLCHDVGKPATIARPEGAWTYYGHDRVGARLAVAVAHREGLVEAARDLGTELDLGRVAWLVGHHLFWLHGGERVGDRAILRRFGRAAGDLDGRGDDLRALTWCDGLGSRGPDGRPNPAFLVAAEVRLAEARQRQVERTARARAAAPPLDGRRIMRGLGIEPGPRVGAVQGWLAERSADAAEAEGLLARHAAFLRTAGVETLRAG